MLTILLRIFFLLLLLALIFIQPTWALFVAAGFVCRYVYFRGGGLTHNAPVIILTACASALLFITTCQYVPLHIAYDDARYAVRVNYDSAGKLWVINEEIIPENIDRIAKRLGEIALSNKVRTQPFTPGGDEQLNKDTGSRQPSDQEVLQEGRNRFLAMMSAGNWEYTGPIADKERFVRHRQQAVNTRMITSYVVNEIPVPRANSPGELTLIPDKDSTAVVQAPENFVIGTFPSSTAVDMLNGKEQWTIPLESPTEDYPVLRLKLAHPYLRNKPGAALVKASLWEPVYWGMGGILGLINKQIESVIFTPFVKWLLKLLRIPYKEKEKPEGNDPDPPNIAREE